MEDMNGISDKISKINTFFREINDNIIDFVDEEDNICIIEDDIKDLDDLIMVSKKYGSPKPKPTRKFSVDVKILHNLVDPLKKLKNVIGMDNVKNQIIDQILASLLDMYDPNLMFHTIIKGPPGVGKTMLAKILAEIYLKMGILRNDKNELKFKIARRSDLIGKYLGHTAVKTQEVIDSCEGGVLFIDEVYSLGNKDKKDSFAKECIDTINLNLTEKKNFICIVAGYPMEIEKCFFNYNPGLKRRFPFGYEIKDYSSEELCKIFMSKIDLMEWKFSQNIIQNNELLTNFIDKHKDSFSNFGGDIDNLILNCKIVHGRRVFGKNKDIQKILTMDDINSGFDRFVKNKKNNKEEDNPPFMMYL
jgi:SpoVK/Ycf46/Vps4 family AAA+-type ATPase